MNNKKGIIISILTIVTLIILATNVFATSQDLNTLLSSGSTESEFTQIQQGNNVINESVTSTSNNIITSNNTISNNNIISSNNTVSNKTLNNTTLPQTGLDYSLSIMIVVCAASIIYAYTKIRKSDI